MLGVLKWNAPVGGSLRILSVIGAAFIGAVLGLAAPRAGAADEKVLNVYNWSDYIGETTVKDFEKETGIKVRYDTYDSNESLHAKLVAGHTGYDIVVPTATWAKLQMAGGLLRKIDKSKIPNYGSLDPWVMKQIASVDPGNDYLVPWMWGFTTVGINAAKVKAALGALPMPENAWDLVFKPEYASRMKSCGVSMLESPDEIIPAALRYIGKSPYTKDPADYAAVGRMLASVRPSVTLFSSSGYINELAGGSLCVAVGWNGDIGIARTRAIESKNGQDIRILIPSTGGVLFFDNMAIPADAAHVENAYKWINFILRPEVQAAMVNKVGYANPVRAADKLIKPDIRANRAIFLEGDDLRRMVAPEAVGNDVRRMRTRVMAAFKTGS